jgi:hypothetical protein
MEKELQKYMTPAAKNYLLCSWYRYMFKYIPFRTGLMASLMDIPEDEKERKNIKLSPEEAKQIGLAQIEANPDNVIHFRAPYASRQNEGDNFNFTRDLHSEAQAHWEQVAADLHGEQIINELKAFIKKEWK